MPLQADVDRVVLDAQEQVLSGSTIHMCRAMCLAGRDHSPTVKQKEEKQQQKQPLLMARATERLRLPFRLCGLAAHGSSTPT